MPEIVSKIITYVILLNTHSKSQLVSFQHNDDTNLVLLQHKEIQEKKNYSSMSKAVGSSENMGGGANT